MRGARTGLGKTRAALGSALVRFETATGFAGVGFLVGLGDGFALLHVVDRQTVLLNGYSASRLDDVCALGEERDSFVASALELKGARPEPLDVPLDRARAILHWLARRGAVVHVWAESGSPDGLVGEVERLADDHVLIEGLDGAGRWTGYHERRYDDITRIDFGRGYLEALATVVRHASAERSHSARR